MSNTKGLNSFNALISGMDAQKTVMSDALQKRAEHNTGTLGKHAETVMKNSKSIAQAMMPLASSPRDLVQAWTAYIQDASQRAVLFSDAMRQFSDTVKKHNDEGAPPVLVYDSELVMDGKDQPRPCNYFLLRLLPKDDSIKIDNTKRPVVIVDPRAGHGGGIGGFKKDSQVGVAFNHGHPVYFVAFHQAPIPGQTLAMVTDAEAAFLREVERLHPDAAKPVVVGNCQGGWATAILAATHPELTGPIVLNGAPMSYWAGKVGQDMMRYSGGLAGGALPAMVAGDMAGGVFDGADLVLNFEALNPARNWFGKYFDLYQNVDSGIPRFLEFERWWGGFYLLTTEEISWIVENLFVGNKLAQNTAQLEPGRQIDLRNIKAPIICFASHGDNITPPGQALNWIIDTYSSAQEIEVRGQRILYMLHEKTGHLGIFVSSKIANREDVEIAETLAQIEALPPGLYEMKIEDLVGEGKETSFTLSIASRNFDDIIAATGERTEEPAFAAVARGSEALTEAYESSIRPFIVNNSNPDIGEAVRKMHPMRQSRRLFTSDHPGMAALAHQAETVRNNRHPVAPDNPFLQAERNWGELVETAWDRFRDIRETAIELSFLGLYMSPWAMMYGAKRNQGRTKPDASLLAQSPEVRASLANIEKGGLAEGLIRTFVLIGQSSKELHLETLTRALTDVQEHEPLRSLPADACRAIIREQTTICAFDAERALETLPKLLSKPGDVNVVLDAVDLVFGPETNTPPVVFELSRKVRARLEKNIKSPPRAKPAANDRPTGKPIAKRKAKPAGASS